MKSDCVWTLRQVDCVRAVCCLIGRVALNEISRPTPVGGMPGGPNSSLRNRAPPVRVMGKMGCSLGPRGPSIATIPIHDPGRADAVVLCRIGGRGSRNPCGAGARRDGRRGSGGVHDDGLVRRAGPDEATQPHASRRVRHNNKVRPFKSSRHHGNPAHSCMVIAIINAAAEGSDEMMFPAGNRKVHKPAGRHDPATIESGTKTSTPLASGGAGGGPAAGGPNDQGHLGDLIFFGRSGELLRVEIVSHGAHTDDPELDGAPTVAASRFPRPPAPESVLVDGGAVRGRQVFVFQRKA